MKFCIVNISWIYNYIIINQYSVCVADLYQVNKTRTQCYSDVAEFICSYHNSLLTWTVTSIASDERSDTLSFNSQFNIRDNIKYASVDSTQVTAELIFGNFTFSLARLTIKTNLSASIMCNEENITYHHFDCE